MNAQIELMGKVLCRDCGRDHDLRHANVTWDCGVNQSMTNMIICDVCFDKRETEYQEGSNGV